MENEDLSYKLLGFIVLIIIITSIIAVVIYTKKHDTFSKIIDKDPIENYTLILSAEQNGTKIYDLQYELLENNQCIQEGLFQEGFILEYINAKNNTNYSLNIISDEYYSETKLCNINNIYCTAQIQKIADPRIDYIIYDDMIRYTIYIDEGTLKNTAICLWENTDKIINIIPYYQNKPMLSVPILNRLNKYYSQCYYLTDYETYKSFYYDQYKDQDIKKYNKEYNTNYKAWKDMPIDDSQVNNMSIDLSKGFYDIELHLTYDDYQYKHKDKIKFILVDLYNETNLHNINGNDKEIIIDLENFI